MKKVLYPRGLVSCHEAHIMSQNFGMMLYDKSAPKLMTSGIILKTLTHDIQCSCVIPNELRFLTKQDVFSKH